LYTLLQATRNSKLLKKQKELLLQKVAFLRKEAEKAKQEKLLALAKRQKIKNRHLQKIKSGITLEHYNFLMEFLENENNENTIRARVAFTLLFLTSCRISEIRVVKSEQLKPFFNSQRP
jgi:hypothetical protein